MIRPFHYPSSNEFHLYAFATTIKKKPTKKIGSYRCTYYIALKSEKSGIKGDLLYHRLRINFCLYNFLSPSNGRMDCRKLVVGILARNNISTIFPYLENCV